MAQATVFNPVTKERKVVNVGDPNAFKGGFMLETPTQNLKTYSATPPKEIARDGSQLFARDNATGASAPVQNPAQLGNMVNNGYQDTRAPLFPASSAPSSSMPSAGNSMPPAPAQSNNPSVNPAESYNFAVAQLLRQAQSANTGDQDLLEKRNKLIQERFNAGNATTPEALRVLSPGQQASLRGETRSGLEDQLSGVNTALQGRERQRATAMDLVKEAQSMLKDYQTQQNQSRDDARSMISTMITQFGSKAFDGVSADDISHLEGQAGLPKGALTNGVKTLKERELEEEKKNKYPAGMVGEYQFYRDQEIAAGRAPKSFEDYQNDDANRKRLASQVAGSNNMTSQQTSTFLNITNKFQADPIIKNAEKGAQAISIADQVLANPNSATNQLKALYSLVKVLDPDSAVREGEIGLAQQTQSYLDTFKSYFTKIVDGQVISPQAAMDLANASKDLAQIWYQSAERRKNQYASQANVAGVGEAFSQYTGSFSQPYFPTSPSSPTSAPSLTDEQRIQQEEQRRGASMSPAERQRFLQQNSQEQADPLNIRFKSESQTSLNGKPGSLTTRNPNPSKVIASSTGTYDFTNYATDPNWGVAVKTHLSRMPNFSSASDITSFVRKQAPGSPITGDMVLASANKFNVDPRLILAIAKQEANYATLGRAARTFNPGNVGNVDSGSNINWGSWQSGMDALARNISKRLLTTA